MDMPSRLRLRDLGHWGTGVEGGMLSRPGADPLLFIACGHPASSGKPSLAQHSCLLPFTSGY